MGTSPGPGTGAVATAALTPGAAARVIPIPSGASANDRVPGLTPARFVLGMWLMFGAVFLPTILVLLTSGRAESLGGTIEVRMGLALQGVAYLPGLIGIAVVALPLVRGIAHVRLTATTLVLLALFAWTIFTTALAGQITDLGISSWLIGGLCVLLTVAASNVNFSVTRAVLVPLIAVGIASLAWVVVWPETAIFDITRSSLNPLPGRLAGISEHPNLLGVLMGTLLVLSIASRRWPYALTGSTVAIACLMLSESRTALAAAAVTGLLVVVVRNAGRARAVAAATLTLGTLVIAGLAASIPLWLDVREWNVALSERPALWEYLVARLPEQWLAGHGALGVAQLRTVDGLLPLPVAHAHNILLHQLFTAGVVGALLMGALLAVAAVAAARQAAGREYFALAIVLFVLISSPMDLVVSIVLSPASVLVLTLVTTICARSDAGERPALDGARASMT